MAVQRFTGIISQTNVSPPQVPELHLPLWQQKLKTELATSRTADASKKKTQILAKCTDMNLEESRVTKNPFLLGNYLDSFVK